MTDRTALLRQQLDERILCLDGAMGTAIQTQDLTPEDFGGESLHALQQALTSSHSSSSSPPLNLDLIAGVNQAASMKALLPTARVLMEVGPASFPGSSEYKAGKAA